MFVVHRTEAGVISRLGQVVPAMYHVRLITLMGWKEAPSLSPLRVVHVIPHSAPSATHNRSHINNQLSARQNCQLWALCPNVVQHQKHSGARSDGCCLSN